MTRLYSLYERPCISVLYSMCPNNKKAKITSSSQSLHYIYLAFLPITSTTFWGRWCIPRQTHLYLLGYVYYQANDKFLKYIPQPIPRRLFSPNLTQVSNTLAISLMSLDWETALRSAFKHSDSVHWRVLVAGSISMQKLSFLNRICLKSSPVGDAIHRDRVTTQGPSCSAPHGTGSCDLT